MAHALALLALLSAADAGAPPAAKPPAGECRKLKDTAKVKVNLEPDSEVATVISWYARTTCTGVLMTSATPLAGKKVTITAPEPITIAELRRLFHAALDSVGLAAEPEGNFLRIVDANKARRAPVRVR